MADFTNLVRNAHAVLRETYYVRRRVQMAEEDANENVVEFARRLRTVAIECEEPGLLRVVEAFERGDQCLGEVFWRERGKR